MQKIKMMLAAFVTSIAALTVVIPSAHAHDVVCGGMSPANAAKCHYGYVKKAGSGRYDIRSAHGVYRVVNVKATWQLCGPNSFCGSFNASYVKPGLGGSVTCNGIKVRIDAHTGNAVRFLMRQGSRWVTLTDKTDC